MKFWLKHFLLTISALACAISVNALADDPPAAHIAADQPAEVTPFWGTRIFGYMPVRDGVRLAYSALLPKGKGPFPAVVNYSGYDPAAIGGPAYRHSNTAMSMSLDRSLVEAGYAVVGVNTRGTGCSEGLFDFQDSNFGPDGRDIVEFIAAQPWSNTSVGMANFSWAGISQLLTAAERPPHLKAIVPGMVLADGRDSGAPGGVPAPNVRQGWWAFVLSRWQTVQRDAQERNDMECLMRLKINFENANRVPPTTITLQHPLRDDYIEQRSIAVRAANIEVPVLSMTAFQDQIVTSRDGHYQDFVKPNLLWVVQTNGAHDSYLSLAFRQKMIRFLDRFVKGVNNNFDREPRVEVWYESASQGTGLAKAEQMKPRFVVTRPTYPAALETVRFVLGANETLAENGNGSGDPDSYLYPLPSATVNTGLEGSNWGPSPPDFKKGAVIYTSPPLERALVTYGSASANLWVSTLVVDTDLQVTLTEVRPDGQEMFVQRGWLRMSNRAIDDGRSTELRPHLLDSTATIRALDADVPVLGRLELNNFAHVFRRGSRLRLWIDAPSASGFLQLAPFSLPSLNKIWHDAAHHSYLALGVLTDVSPPEKASLCGTVLMQPCRPDPLNAANQEDPSKQPK